MTKRPMRYWCRHGDRIWKVMLTLQKNCPRFYGYDRIPTSLPSGEATTGRLSEKLKVEKIVRNVAQFCGFSQGMTYSFESPKVFDKLLLDKDDVLRQAIVISNPLGEDFSIMRTLPLNGMMTSLATNANRRNKDVRFVEMENVSRQSRLPLLNRQERCSRHLVCMERVISLP